MSSDNIDKSNGQSDQMPEQNNENNSRRESDRPRQEASHGSPAASGESSQQRTSDQPDSDGGEKHGPADNVPGLQKDASSRDLYFENERLHEWLVADDSLNARNVATALAAVLVVFIGLVYFTGRAEILAQDLLSHFTGPAEPAEIAAPEPEAAPTDAAAFTLGALPSHPDQLYQPYTAGPMIQAAIGGNRAPLISQFRQELDIFTKRQGVDSNFQIRLYDNRTYEQLEVYTLEDEQRRFEELGEPDDFDWSAVDRQRARKQSELVDKYVRQGIPREYVSVRWGRANQIQQARDRDLPFLEHEINLANYLGLSLLVTQIGVVETFNQDWLVSPVGARGRYQMMPYILREARLYHFDLPTAAGNTVQVLEERHPLLMMEPAFYLLRGYINAVGHELPGISAYHTGPGNIFMVLRQFLSNAGRHLSPSTTVMDGYMWAITEGFDTVSRGTSFGNHSRGYVTSAYGALRAQEDTPIDTSRTFHGDRVQLQSGETVQLSQLLRALRGSDDLYWGYGTNDLSIYERFKEMNPHIRLPSTTGEGVPVRGDVRLSATVNGNPLRFFLPIGAVDVLKQQGLDVFDEDKTFRFDRNAYPNPDLGEKTIWDRQYEQLVERISNFGFTEQNRRILFELADRFDQMAEENPTHYRLAQQRIIDIHRRMWMTNGWRRLSGVTTATLGTERPQIQPPSLPTSAIGPTGGLTD